MSGHFLSSLASPGGGRARVALGAGGMSARPMPAERIPCPACGLSGTICDGSTGEAVTCGTCNIFWLISSSGAGVMIRSPREEDSGITPLPSSEALRIAAHILQHRSANAGQHQPNENREFHIPSPS